MPKQIKIEVLESENFLRNALRKTTTDMYRARIKTLLILKQNSLKYKKDIAKKLAYSEKSIRNWILLYENRKRQISFNIFWKRRSFGLAGDGNCRFVAQNTFENKL